MKVMKVLHANLEVLRAVTPKSQVVWDVALRRWTSGPCIESSLGPNIGYTL